MFPDRLDPVTSFSTHSWGGSEINYILGETCFERRMSGANSLGRILSGSDGFGWDVTVPYDPARYDAKTIVRMVKQVNRRGRVRYFELWDDGDENRWEPHPDPIKGVDYLEDFIREILEPDTPVGRMKAISRLVVSFDDKSDARAFARDLEQLVIAPAAKNRMLNELQAARRNANSHTPDSYPPHVMIKQPVGMADAGGGYWVALVKPLDQNPHEIATWFKRNIKWRYWACTWRPSTDPIMAQLSWRYWRLSVVQWQALIATSANQASYLLIDFADMADARAFDNRFGPAQFVQEQLVPAPSRA